MKERLTEKFERIFSAVTFAEAGEFETARGILGGASGATFADGFSIDSSIDDLISVAITFAESGEHDKALEVMKDVNNKLGEMRAVCNKKMAAAHN